MDKQVLLEELKNALVHLNDVAQLADSPLAQELLPHLTAGETASLGMQTRNLLIGLIESMKPSAEVPESASEWRQYHILHDRYVLHRPLWEMEHKLTIGERQVRREHSRGVAIVAEMLQAKLASIENLSAEPAATPREAIERLTPVARVFSLSQLVDEIVGFLTAAGRIQESMIQVYIMPEGLTVSTDPGILRQLLTRLLLSVISQLGTSTALALDAFTLNGHITIALNTGSTAIDPADESLQLCQLMAQTLGTEIKFNRETGNNANQSITFTLQSGNHVHKVLVIDDELAAIELFQSYVIGLNYHVIGETNAEQALARATEDSPDVIILDVMMPAIDGWELLQRLRHTPQTREVPIIVCSVLGEADLAAALGATAFLKKPILRSHLLNILKQLTH